MKRILMVAAENDALPGAKVGGVGDVIRDLPHALNDLGCVIDVVIPSYGFLTRLENIELADEFAVRFMGKEEKLTLFRVLQSQSGVTNYILHSPLFAPCGEHVYCNDPDNRPFATDATKFSMFCIAILELLAQQLIEKPDVIHCHDWHTGFLFILKEYALRYASLKSIRTVFTIHNLAMQGIRPLKNDESSLENWFPDLHYDGKIICDPSNLDCVNPMRAAILLADKVQTVSPSYAQEILVPSDHARGIYGGEGLERDLVDCEKRGKLHGILNGCEYPSEKRNAKPSRKKVKDAVDVSLLSWAGKQRELSSAHWIAKQRIDTWAAKKSAGFTLVSIGRMTNQKVRLLTTRITCNAGQGRSALQRLLDVLGDNGTYIMLGTGDPKLEDFFTDHSGRNTNFIFLKGYSSALSDMLYSYGDLFLMPSSFEPCGISQMLAMRAGQPCMVNNVGGLKDTVRDRENGFVFEGADCGVQARAMIDKAKEALSLYSTDEEAWKKVCHFAGKTRLTWEESAKEYVEKLYC